MDPARLKREYGERPLLLGLDRRAAHPALRHPARGPREVRERIATLGDEGGLILAPTHHVQLDTPLENFWAMVKTITGRHFAKEAR